MMLHKKCATIQLHQLNNFVHICYSKRQIIVLNKEYEKKFCKWGNLKRLKPLNMKRFLFVQFSGINYSNTIYVECSIQTVKFNHELCFFNVFFLFDTTKVNFFNLTYKINGTFTRLNSSVNLKRDMKFQRFFFQFKRSMGAFLSFFFICPFSEVWFQMAFQVKCK